MQLDDINYLENLKLNFSSISIYNNIANDKALKALHDLAFQLDRHPFDIYACLESYGSFFNVLSEICTAEECCSLKEHVVNCIMFSDNVFTQAAGREEFSALDHHITSAARSDLDKLKFIAQTSSRQMKSIMLNKLKVEFEQPSAAVMSSMAETVSALPEWPVSKYRYAGNYIEDNHLNTLYATFMASDNWSDCVEAAAQFHYCNGFGDFTRYRAFIWQDDRLSGGNNTFRDPQQYVKGHLEGVKKPDPVLLSSFIGYEEERSIVINNTLSFLKGLPANNILLYGDRGTGKSSTVKAILNEYHSKGLRMIEISKSSLYDFPVLLKELECSSLKFIIFIDDLSFDDNEENYAALKAVLEGSIAAKPSNVIIYATSNRRHLIKETFSDRAGLSYGSPDDEIHASDSIQEKLSLADRFGITIVFSSPDKEKYLGIVDGLAKARGLNFNIDYLHKEALKWELWYNGRSPRTARQFIDWLAGQKPII